MPRSLERLHQVEILSEYDVLLAQTLADIGHEECEDVLFAIALLSQACAQGEARVRVHDLQRSAAKELSSTNSAESWVELLAASNVVGETVGPEPVVLEGGWLYFRRYWYAARAVAQHIARRVHTQPTAHPVAELDLVPAPTADQRAAVQHALSDSLFVICGGPGSGKTQTVRYVLQAWAQGRSNDKTRTLLLAPTGKAAHRLAEAASGIAGNWHAQTVHQALGARRRGGYRHDETHPLEANLVVVDEASMLDLELALALLKALPHDCNLVLVGDPDQLGPIRPGAILKDLCRETSPVQVVRLEASHRHPDGSHVSQLAQAIRSGNGEEALGLLKNGDAGLVYRDYSAVETVLAPLCNAYAALLRKPSAQALDALGQRQLLVPYRRGRLGAMALNQRLEASIARDDVSQRPIIIQRNEHDLELYNGDLGLLDTNHTATFFDRRGKVRIIPEGRLPAHELAYAITVHKSQGSEFDEVVLIIPEEATPLLTREMLYTAITRAKRRVTLIASDAAVLNAIANPKHGESGLADHLTRTASGAARL